MAIEALYLHIPFCQSKCAYCDFDSVAACSLDDARTAQACYLDRLTNRVDAFGTVGLLDGVRTVYIGGGTPSLLGMRLVELVRSVMQWCTPEEFTCEANPESFTSSLALQLARAGVTRISLGVQSLQEEELKAVGRIHSATQALDAICYAKDAGLDVSCDLMCGLPLQTQDSWAKSVAGLIEAGPCHVSIYPLTVEDGTPLALKVDSGRLVLPDEDEQADEMELARRFLVEAGFAPYEVASYALPGHACRHNIAYWTGIEYLGLGRSAASMFSRDTFRMSSSLFSDLAPRDGAARIRVLQTDDAASAFEIEQLGIREAMAEDLMLACRMTRGIPQELLLRASAVFGKQIVADTCARAIELGLATWEAPDGENYVDASSGGVDLFPGALAPTQQGWLEGNELFGLFWNLA
ncbi:coproporphyrinogen-III oxidase family protein [Collinsella bouchesdurhonensis]|uniref:coproporphyrinogen-III oxidase family protein n=1 Tax=Collinsella bouchesdurhonensis TaxID=1907654 RepID=UPI00110736EC|nr:coproporphyrinogen-III oxidase family protein [Collinsella bouchesdurhonensis]